MFDPRESAQERWRVFFGVASPVALIVAMWATRDALFLTAFDVSWLPRVLAVSALGAVLVVFPLVRFVTQRGPERLLRATLVAGAVGLLVMWWLREVFPRGVAFCLYVQSDLLGSIVTAAHGVLLTERLGTRRLQRHLPETLGAVVLGAAVGGLVAEIVAARGVVAPMLPLLAVAQAVMAFGLPQAVLGRRPPAAPAANVLTGPKPRPSNDPFLIPFRSSYLRILGLVLLTVSAGAIPFDYALKWSVATRLDDGPRLLQFFGVFHAAVGLAGLLLQGLVGRLALERLGLAGTLSALPASVLAGGGALLAGAGIATATLARGFELAARRGLFRPAYALLYTPVPAVQRRSVRTLMEVLAERLGEAVGGALVLILLATAPRFGLRALAALAIVLAALAMLAIHRLQRAYTQALERSLVGHAVELDSDSVQDRTTRTLVASLRERDLQRTWHESTLGMRLDDLHRMLAEAGPPAGGAGATPGHPPASDPGLVSAPADPAPKPTIPPIPASPRRMTALDNAIADLRSGDVLRIRRVLVDPEPLHRELVPYVLPLLARNDVAVAAIEALQRVASQVTGMIVDVLLDPEEPVAVRRRLPRLLATSPDARGVEGLLRSLEDARSEVRLQSGRALARLHLAHPEIPFDRGRVMALVVAEARRGKRVWESQQSLETADEREDSPLVDEVLRDRANRSLEHVFTLLSLVLPLEPLRIAFAGLHTDDPVLRNTALEYLYNELSADVRSSLWPLVADRGVAPRPAAPQHDALADLMSSNQSIQINLEELRRRLEQGS